MADAQWTISVKQGLAASFKSESGVSQQGVLWAVQLRGPNREHNVLVKAIFSESMMSDARSNYEQQASVVVQYIQDLLADNWDPADEMEHRICISDV